MIWQDMHGSDSEPMVAAIRHCVGELVDRPAMLERAEQAFQVSLEARPRAPDLHAGPELYDSVASALRSFG